jgi:Flp pilus assembly protein TadG
MRARVGRSDTSGQATVEAALVLPFLVTLLLAVVQVGLLARDQVLVTHAAREAARAAAVNADHAAVVDAAHGASSLHPDRMTVDVEGRQGPGSHVTVHVAYDAPTDVPLVGALLGDVELDGDATMRVE